MNKTNTLKEQLHETYFIHFTENRAKRIKDHQKLERKINSKVAINKSEYTKSQTRTSFNGLIFGILTVILYLES